MPRTRQSSRLIQGRRKSHIDTDSSGNTEPNVASPVKSKTKKKRTVSDRSPVVNTRKKSSTFVSKNDDTSSPKENRGISLEENKENVMNSPMTPGVTPYWKVRYDVSLKYVCSRWFKSHLSIFNLHEGCRR